MKEKSLTSNYKSLSKKYLEAGGATLTEEEVAAYVIARMPATYAAAFHVLQEVSRRVERPITSLLDLGAGPGTGAVAARGAFPGLSQITLVEKNKGMIAQGKKILEGGEWIEKDILDAQWGSFDLALFSYSLGELKEEIVAPVLEKAWHSAPVVVIIEPGTPRGFHKILKARDLLIGWKGKVIAPCPHSRACPMKGGEWCHFSERLSRSKEHKSIKEAELGWEDEKFSYVVVVKEESAHTPTKARLLNQPQKRSGHVGLKLCTEAGIEDQVISRKQGALYKRARKLKWGDDLFSEAVVEEGNEGACD